jgi:CubicO group peptidase (beta-lactamase class C family)
VILPASLAVLALAPQAVEGATGKLLDAHVRALDAQSGGFCGAVLVASKGKILLEQGYGIADKDTGRTIAADALFDWASVSKQFTAAAVLALEMQKKLSIQDKLARFFPKAPPDKAGITLVQLLSHTSGLPKGFDPEWKWDHSTRQGIFDLALSLPLAAQPGTKFEYNNMPYGFLAGLVEELSGKPFEDFCCETLFDPAGMKSASFIGHERLDRARVPRDERGAGHPFPYGPKLDWGYRGCGGVMASVHDMWLWDRALRGDKLLSKAAKQELYTPFLEGYALGWYVGDDVKGRRVEHGGDTRATCCYFGRWLEEDLVVAIAYTYKPALDKFTTGRALAQIARSGKPAK